MTQFNIGKNIAIEVDVAKIMSHANVVQGLVEFAIRQRLTNAHASITETVEPDEAKRKAQSEAAAMKLLDSMLRGEYAITERGSRADDITTELRRMADADLRKAMAKAGIKVADLEKGVFSKSVAAHAESNRAKWLEAATIAVEAKKGAERTDTIDLASLGLVKKADAPATPATEETAPTE